MHTRTALLLIALSACSEAAPPAATVGPVSFTEDQLLGLSPGRRATLVHLTALGLAVADSSAAELGAPLLSRWQDDALLDVLAADLTLQKQDVFDDALEARYLTDPEYELTVRHILFFSERWRTPAERAAAKVKADRALELLRGGADFAETAAQLSEEPGAEGRQGMLTPGREGAWVDEFWAAASALEVGQISAVTETEYGFHILRLEARAVVPFAEERSRVVREVADRLEDPAAVLSAWQDDRAPALDLNEKNLALAPALEAGAALASWPDGQVTFRDYLSWEASEPTSWHRGGMGSDRDAFTASVTALARRRMALDEADARRVVLPQEERAQLARRWDDLIYRWSETLGFRYGAGPEAVGQAALAALANPAQDANIVRDEVDRRAPLLVARYEMIVTETGTPTPP